MDWNEQVCSGFIISREKRVQYLRSYRDTTTNRSNYDKLSERNYTVLHIG